MSRADRQAALKAAYGALYSHVSRLVREGDPLHLIAIGAPDDEYDPEISTILPRLREATCRNDVHRIVHEEFAHWFGADIAGPPETYSAVSEAIWSVWQQSAAVSPTRISTPSTASDVPPRAPRGRTRARAGSPSGAPRPRRN